MKHANDCKVMADEVRSKKRLHDELSSALDEFMQSTQRLKQGLLARNSNKENESQNLQEVSLDNMLDAITV